MIKRTFLADRAAYGFGAVALLLALVVPGVFPAFASAAQLQSRSMELSTSGAGATNVKYTLGLTTQDGDATSVVIDFCNDSPIIGQVCTAPVGFDASSVASADGAVTGSTASTIKFVPTTPLSGAATVEFTGITNPTSATTLATGFYARVTTYADNDFGNTSGTAYSGPQAVGTTVDDGGIAMAITPDIAVTAAVRETMTFCVSGTAPTKDCGGTDSPSLSLGHGTPKALDSSAVDTATNYAQISTNASSGAVVRMSNSNVCGGLHRAGALASVCDIAAVGTAAAIANGEAKFGLNVGDGTIVASSGGTGDTTADADYSGSSLYGMVTANVTSDYGDEIFNTGGAPINNVNVPLTFAAGASNTTPAGLYSATINLVATGTY